MGRFYTIPFETAAGDGTARTLMLLENPADTVLKIVGINVVAVDNDTNEQLNLRFQRVNVIGTPVGTAVTPTQHSTGDSASGITATADLSTEPTSYLASTEIGFRGASSLGGYIYDPPERAQLEISPDQDWGLRVIDAFTAKSLSIEIVIEELGG